MTAEYLEIRCLNCNQAESATPLLHLHYKGKETWICSQCLPTLIHAPQKLTGKIEDAEQIKPAAHHKH
jgi:hypothetical protein